MRPIRVLVCDDSLMFRNMLVKGLNTDPNIEVVAQAADAYEARDAIIKYKPDVMTLDVEMPKMSGIEFVKKLMPQYPLPVVAMKVKIASTAKVAKYKFAGTETVSGHVSMANKNRIVAIGASTGGTEAIFEVVKRFKRDIPGVVIVQHMPPGFTKMYAERLNNQCEVAVKEAETGDVVRQGHVLLAPGSMQMKLVKVNGVYQVECKGTERVNGHCPSVDVLFNSVARLAGKDAIGVILTGMGGDGAKGLLEMRNAGAQTIGQDEATCVVYGMPKVAYDLGAVQYQLGVTAIAGKVYSLLSK